LCAFVILGQGNPSNSNICLVQYLQRKNLLNEEFSSNNDTECKPEDFVESAKPTIDRIFYGLSKMSKGDFPIANKQCIGNNVMEMKIEDQFYLREVYKKATHLSENEKGVRESNISNRIKEILKDSILKCESEFIEKFLNQIDDKSTINPILYQEVRD
jgi:hypothetical protein